MDSDEYFNDYWIDIQFLNQNVGENTIKIINLVKSNPSLSCGPVKDGFIQSRNRFQEAFADKTGINVHIQQSGNTQQS